MVCQKLRTSFDNQIWKQHHWHPYIYNWSSFNVKTWKHKNSQTEDVIHKLSVMTATLWFNNKKVSLCTKLFLNPSGSNFIGRLAFVIAHSSYGGCGIVEVLIFLYADYIKYNLFFSPTSVCI